MCGRVFLIIQVCEKYINSLRFDRVVYNNKLSHCIVTDTGLVYHVVFCQSDTTNDERL